MPPIRELETLDEVPYQFIDHAQFVAMEIGLHIEPRLVIQVGHVDHERIAFPARPRIPLEQLDIRVGMLAGQMQDAVSGRRFVELIGSEGGKDWRLFDEFVLEDGRPIQLAP